MAAHRLQYFALLAVAAECFGNTNFLAWATRIKGSDQICAYLRSPSSVSGIPNPRLAANTFAVGKIETTAAVRVRPIGVPQSRVDSILRDESPDLCKEISSLQGVATTTPENEITDTLGIFFGRQQSASSAIQTNSHNTYPFPARSVLC
jgi:hypothetical protein